MRRAIGRSDKGIGLNTIEADPDGTGMRVGVVASRFNKAIVDGLVAGALRALADAGVADDDITLVWVPGAFELGTVAQELALAGCDAVVCLGVVIRGATDHYTFVCEEAARGVGAAARSTRTPVTFGVLTTDTVDQALERADTSGADKGGEVARGAIEMASALAKIREPATT